MKRLTTVALVLSALALGVTNPAVALYPPHDDSNDISCNDCHAVHNNRFGLVPRGEEQANMCKSCHNPTGIAASMSEVANHVVDGMVLDCGTCHAPHGPEFSTNPHTGTEAPNLSLLRADIQKYAPWAADETVFQLRPQHFAFGEDDEPWNGICQTCHTQTDHHTQDSRGDHSHWIGAACTSCHPHRAGFEPQGGCFECHDEGQGQRRPIVGANGDFGRGTHHVRGELQEDDCIVCHSLTTHGSGAVRLKDPDVVGRTHVYDPDNPATLEPVCVGCHDADGTTVGNGRQPFSDGRIVPDIAAAGGWASSAHAQIPFEINGGSPLTCVGDGKGSGCHVNGHGTDTVALLAGNAGDPIDTFCFGCHSANGVENFSLDGTVSDIASAFDKREHHDMGTAFVANGRNFTLQCTTCHNPHLVTGKHVDGVDGRSPVTRPDLDADPAENPRAMGTNVWGDNAAERMDAYAGTGTYRTPRNDPLSGAELPDYATFCLDCHGQTGAPPWGIVWNGDPHGLVSANAPNGSCPDWYSCGKGEGWDGDTCISDEETCWPVLPRSRGEHIFNRKPYEQEERIAGANFVLACVDCHEAHGANRGGFIRERFNTNDVGACGSGSNPGENCADGSNWNMFCNSCHYYYSDWHAGMSCGTASCHISGRMSQVGSSTPHQMGAAHGSSRTKVFARDLVADMRFDGNLNDSGTWSMHGRWFDGAGTYAAGVSGRALELDGDQPVELGTRNDWWSTDEGRHGTWKYSEMKYNTSLEAWVRPTDDLGAEYLIAAKHTYNDGGYAFLLRGGNGGGLRAALLINVNGGGEPEVWDDDCNGLRGAYGSVPIPTNRWSHVAATFDTSRPDRDELDPTVGRIRIYVNGEDVTTSDAFAPGVCYAQPGPGEDIIFSYSLHSPDNESRCYAGHWCGSAFSVGGVMWGSGSRKGLVGRLDNFKLWNVTKPADWFDATVGPRLRDAAAFAGSETLTISFNEGVYADAAPAGGLEPADFVLIDTGGNNPRSIVAVDHVAGEDTMTLTLSAPSAEADLGTDTIAAATGSVFDEYGNVADGEAVVIEDAKAAIPCPPEDEETIIELDEAAGSLTATDTTGILDGEVLGAGSFLGDGLFHGDGVDNFVAFSNPSCFGASTRLNLRARVKPDVVDSGEANDIYRIFGKSVGANYQLSLWRNEAWETYTPPDGAGSFAFWLKPVDPRGGTSWKVVLTHYDSCPTTAGHWYEVTVDWDSERAGLPGRIYVDDQGPDGDDVGELWSGTVDCTDSAQALVAEDQRLVSGDVITVQPALPVLGADAGNFGRRWPGLIDWVRIRLF